MSQTCSSSCIWWTQFWHFRFSKRWRLCWSYKRLTVPQEGFFCLQIIVFDCWLPRRMQHAPPGIKNITDVNAVFPARNKSENSCCLPDCTPAVLLTIGMVNFDINSHFYVPLNLTPSFRASFYASKALLRKNLLSVIINDLPETTDWRPLSYVMLDITTIHAKPLVLFSTYLHT